MPADAWILIVVLGIILVFFSLLRRRGGVARYPETVQALLYDIKWNQALAETFYQRQKPRRFENVNWLMNKNKIGFMGENLKQMLKEVFALVEEYNRIIKQSKKEKSDSYKSIELARFKELLDKCRIELEGWLLEKTGHKELPPKYPSLMGTFFGDR